MESTRQSTFRALTSAGVALETIGDVLVAHPDCGTVALVEDRRESRGTAIPVEGPDPGPARLERLDALLVRAIGEPGCRLVLASVRPGAGPGPTGDDIECWHRMRACHDGQPLVLLDWFLLTGPSRFPVSLADAEGPPAPW